jgi:DNA-binding Lrp family transcriptional regulator
MAGEDVLALNQQDRDRLKELHAVVRGQQKVGEAARHLGLSRRQVRRLVRRLRREGDRGVIHRLRGRPSNRRIPERVRARALALLAQEEYRDFAPTLAAEHLGRIGIDVSRETVRSWQTQAGLWKPGRQKVEAVHVWRQRRVAFGELVLMDTSDHDWLEGRGPRLYLVAMIDDASSRLWGRFVESDSTAENLRTLRGWLERYGRPLALYTDKNTIFQTPRSAEWVEQYGPPPPTDFAAALEELRIEWIPAHSPQAKGRVERLFDTLQDRLVKEMRIAGVASVEQADRFFRERFLPFWNERFTVAPRSSRDAHRPLGSFRLDSVLCHRFERKVSTDYTLRLNGQHWLIARAHVGPGLRHSRVLVEQRLDGSSWVRYRGRHLPLQPAPPPAASPFGLRPPGPAAKPKLPAKACRPPKDHPWRLAIHREALERTLLPGAKADISTLR